MDLVLFASGVGTSVEDMIGHADQEISKQSFLVTKDATRQSKPMTRNCLSKERAMEVYKRRPDRMSFKKNRRGAMNDCHAVAVEFGVTAKTIRDIWRGRTWGEATGHPQLDGVW
jgi:hypothetical protein